MINNFISTGKNLPKKNKLRIFLFFIVSFWCAGFAAHALIPEILFTPHSPFLKLFYSGVCHQNAERTFLINDHALFVCARC